MATGLSSWSKTAASNATADSNVNMAEGMAPSAVNDSVRALMASMAMFRDDINGSIATGGTSTAFTVTSNQVFASLSAMDNAVIAFIPHTTSGAAPTLAVDGLTAKAIRMSTAVDMPSGVLVAGTPYVVTYEHGVGEFLLHNIAGDPWSVPLGCCLPFFGTTAPNSSFVLPYGQAISRTTYATLFTMFSTTFGTGDGSTTFNVPDLRGRVCAGKDDMGGSDSGRLGNASFFGSAAETLGGTGGSESHTLVTAELAAHSHGVTDPGHTHSGTVTDGGHTHIASSGTLFAGTGTGGAASGSGLTALTGQVDLAGSSTGSATTGISVSANSNTTGITTANAGSGTAHNNVQPTIISNWLLRVI